MITNLIKRTNSLGRFGRYRQQRDVQKPLARAYAAFEHRYPEWTASLFDEHFLAHALTPLLMTARDRYGQLTPQAIANAWATQLTMKSVQQRTLSAMALPIAADFLQLFEQELHAADNILQMASC